MLGEKMARNTAVLTVSSLVMRLMGMLWQIWLAGRIGAVGIGLFGLVMSVGFLFGTLALGAARFSVTRLLSEEIGRGREGSTGPVMLRACAYALGCSLLAAAALWGLAEAIGAKWIADGRTVPALRQSGEAGRDTYTKTAFRDLKNMLLTSWVSKTREAMRKSHFAASRQRKIFTEASICRPIFASSA